jgi:hypothetical protein
VTPRRWTWLAGLLAASACGELPEPYWVLDEPRVLAVRVEVVQEGPHSVGLLPIPADRIRTDPLPLDTIEVQPLIADATGILDPAAFELQWLLCPSSGRCLSLLREPGQGGPCDPEHPLPPQAAPRLAMVGGLPGERTTAQCLEHLSEEPYVSLEGCLLAYSSLLLGPLVALLRVAEAEGVQTNYGIELSADLEALGLLPNHNPEVVRLVLIPQGGGPQVVARPGEVTPLLPRRTYFFADWGDPRDNQPYVGLLGADLEQLEVGFSREFNSPQFLTAGPGWLQAQGLEVGEPGETSSLIVVLVEGRGGQAWDVFSFEAAD